MPELRAVSGVGCKGPACFLLGIEGRHLLLDLGRGPDGARLPDLSGLPRIDGIVISHGHADHTGGLVLWDELGRPPLHATAPTIALSGLPALRSAIPLDGLDRILGLPLRTGAAGHAPGAVWMRIGGAGGLLYTGDFSAEGAMFRADPPPPAAALVLDASYAEAREPLECQIADIAAAIDGPVLFPCPAGGRGLELALHLLDAGHEVAICDAHRHVAGVLSDHPGWLTPGGRAGLERLRDRAGRLAPDGPLRGVMVAAGPNAERGTAAPLAQRIVTEGGAQIVFTGHVARDTPAAALVARGLARFRRWNVHPTFPDACALVAAVGPRTMLAAFCEAPLLEGLRARSGWPLAPGERLVW